MPENTRVSIATAPVDRPNKETVQSFRFSSNEVFPYRVRVSGPFRNRFIFF